MSAERVRWQWRRRENPWNKLSVALIVARGSLSSACWEYGSIWSWLPGKLSVLFLMSDVFVSLENDFVQHRSQVPVRDGWWSLKHLQVLGQRI